MEVPCIYLDTHAQSCLQLKLANWFLTPKASGQKNVQDCMTLKWRDLSEAPLNIFASTCYKGLPSLQFATTFTLKSQGEISFPGFKSVISELNIKGGCRDFGVNSKHKAASRSHLLWGKVTSPRHCAVAWADISNTYRSTAIGDGPLAQPVQLSAFLRAIATPQMVP